MKELIKTVGYFMTFTLVMNIFFISVYASQKYLWVLI